MTSQYEKNVLRGKVIVSSVVKRIIWYPLVPLITQGPNFLVETDAYIHQRVSYPLLLVSALSTAEGK